MMGCWGSHGRSLNLEEVGSVKWKVVESEYKFQEADELVSWWVYVTAGVESGLARF